MTVQQHFFKKEHAFAFVLRPAQGVYDIRNLDYVPETPAN